MAGAVVGFAFALVGLKIALALGRAVTAIDRLRKPKPRRYITQPNSGDR